MTSWRSSAVSITPLESTEVGGLRRSTGPEVRREIVRQIARLDASDGTIDVVRHTNEVESALAAAALIRPVCQLFLARVFVPAPAVLVVGGHGRVVITGDAGDAARLEQGYGLVRPGRITTQISKVIAGVDTTARLDVVEYRLQR